MTDQPDLFTLRETPAYLSHEGTPMELKSDGSGLVFDRSTGDYRSLEGFVGHDSEDRHRGDTTKHAEFAEPRENEWGEERFDAANDYLDKVGKVAKRVSSGDNGYVARKYPGASYPGQSGYAHHVVVYHKPTGKAVGYTTMDDSGEVSMMGVHPDHQGSGAATVLVHGASQVLRDTGHPLGIPSSETTTDDSAKMIRAFNPQSTALTNRDYVDHVGTAHISPEWIESNLGVPGSLDSDMKSFDEYRALSDKTGRHPGNFMMLSDNDRIANLGKNLIRRDGQKPDPTTLALIAPREAAKNAENTTVRSEMERLSDRNPRQLAFGARAFVTGSRQAAMAEDDPYDIRVRGQHGATSDHLLGENTLTEQEPDMDTARRRYRNGTNPNVPSYRDEVRADRLRLDGIDNVHDAVWTGEDTGDLYKPRTTEERLAQDPLARARILRGRGGY